MYHKVVRLEKGKPVLVIDHSMKNTGKLAIKSNVYNHHFVVLDKQPPGPDFTFRVPFQIKASRLPNKELAEVRGNEIVYMRPLVGQDQVRWGIQGFGDSAKDHEVIIENRKMGRRDQDHRRSPDDQEHVVVDPDGAGGRALYRGGHPAGR